MLDFSFGELLVVVTGAGLLLGRKEITIGARWLGTSIGRVVGTLQGVRLRYEQKSKGSQIYQLHSSVRQGLQDFGTIGTDLAMLQSVHIRGSYGGNNNIFPYISSSSMRSDISSSNSNNNEKYTTSSTANSTSTTNFGNIQDSSSLSSSVFSPSPAAHHDYSFIQNYNDADIQRLARLMLAEDQLKQQHHSRSRQAPSSSSSSSSFAQQQRSHAHQSAAENQSSNSGIDVIEAALTESIIAESYARTLSAQHKHGGVRESVRVSNSIPPSPSS